MLYEAAAKFGPCDRNSPPGIVIRAVDANLIDKTRPHASKSGMATHSLPIKNIAAPTTIEAKQPDDCSTPAACFALRLVINRSAIDRTWDQPPGEKSSDCKDIESLVVFFVNLVT